MTMTPSQRVEVLRASCCIAGADGEITEGEMAQLLRLAKGVGVGEASLNAMIARAESDQEFHKQQFNVLKDEPLVCLDLLLKSLVANGTVKESEFDILKGLANQLEISEADFAERVNEAVTNVS